MSPGEAADEELRWFFNEAEAACEQPSNFVGLLAGMSPTSLAAVEERAEAMHAAGKIRKWLDAASTTDVLMLEGLYRERVWPKALTKVLGPLVGAVAAWPTVRVQHLRGRACGRTEARTVAEWLEETAKEKPHLLKGWRKEVELACAIAVRAYERARGERRPSVVPGKEVE